MHRNAAQREIGLEVSSYALRKYSLGPESRIYTGSWEQLLDLVSANFQNREEEKGGRACLVPVPAEGFFCKPVVPVQTDTDLNVEYKPRRAGEESFLQFSAVGPDNIPASYVDIVLYSRDAYLEDSKLATLETDAEWVVISIKSRTTVEKAPMNPETMARNFLEKPGGTKSDYTAEEFAVAIYFWSKNLEQKPR